VPQKQISVLLGTSSVNRPQGVGTRSTICHQTKGDVFTNWAQIFNRRNFSQCPTIFPKRSAPSGSLYLPLRIREQIRYNGKSGVPVIPQEQEEDGRWVLRYNQHRCEDTGDCQEKRGFSASVWREDGNREGSMEKDPALYYDNPLIERYASREMCALWGPKRKFST